MRYTINFSRYGSSSNIPEDSILRHPDLQLEIPDFIYKNWQTYPIAGLLNIYDLSSTNKLTPDIESINVIAATSTKKLSVANHRVISMPTVLTITEDLAKTFKVVVGASTYFIHHIDTPQTSARTMLFYKPYLQKDKEGFYWQPSQIIYKDFVKDYLKEQIRARYGFFDRPTNGLSNVVLDSFLPGLLYKYNLDINHLKERETFPKTAVCISPLLAELLEIKRVPTDQLIRILGYSIQDIKDLMTTVKNKQLDFIFAGVGGTGMNGAYWLDELSKLTNTINLFNSIYVYEKENIEFSNTLRFPLPLSTYYKNRINDKIGVVMPLLSRLSTKKIQPRYSYLTKENYPWELFSDDKASSNTVIYGAPGLEYRNSLSAMGNFICATHASNSCSIWLNPTQTESIEVESYGMIQLGGFFMNQLRMTIGLLELLASDIPLDSRDREFLNYTFDGTNRLRCDRLYNFQLSGNLTMMTEEQANNI